MLLRLGPLLAPGRRRPRWLARGLAQEGVGGLFFPANREMFRGFLNHVRKFDSCRGHPPHPPAAQGHRTFGGRSAQVRFQLEHSWALV